MPFPALAAESKISSLSRWAPGPRQVSWIHARHGALLKHPLVIRVPSILVVSTEGEALARLDPTAEAVAGWRRP